MKVIYILTYDCNFRCEYCDVHKRKDTISSEVVQASFSFFEKNRIDVEEVKFFGGEPLLASCFLFRISNHLPEASLFVTTNASLVTDSFMNLMVEKKAKVTFSIDGNVSTMNAHRKSLSGGFEFSSIFDKVKKYHEVIRVNQVITSKTSRNFFENFLFIYDMGVRQFNFLPQYYGEWTKQGLKDLKEGFDRIQNFVQQGHHFTLVNLENYSEVAFFNVGLVIDTNGDIYLSNLILSGVFESYKPQLKVGSVFDGLFVDISDKDFLSGYISQIQNIVQREYSSQVLKSVQYVDSILNNFCYEFSQLK